jgi:predicted dehydrogenase
MALDFSPEQKEVGKTNFHRAVGTLAEADAAAAAARQGGMTRRRFMQGLLAGAGVALPVSAAVYFGFAGERFGPGGQRPVKAGLIGAGDEGGVLVGEHNPNYLEFIAYSDIRPSNRQRIFTGEPTGPRRGFNHHYGNEARKKIRLYENYRELLANPEIEAVVIALPLNLHASVSIDAMRAGKHVLCEKLMARTITQCKDMIRVANETDRVLAIGHQRHYSMLYAHALEVINSGILGDVRHIRALWHRNMTLLRLDAQNHEQTEHLTIDGNSVTLPIYRDSWRPAIKSEDRLTSDQLRRAGFRSMEELVRWRLYNRTGGGLMAELGSHQLDASSIFLGKVHPLAVSGVGGRYFYHDDREIEDHVFCTFEFPGKNYHAVTAQPGKVPYEDKVIVTYSSISTNNFEPYGECVMGTRGTLVVEEEQRAMLWGGATTTRSTAVSVSTTGPGAPALTSEASPASRAVETGQASLGHAPPSRGYKEEMEHLAYVIRMRGQGMSRDRANVQVRCPGPAAMADAIIALTANQAMRQHRRIEFDPRWFDPTSPEVPDRDVVVDL